MKVSELKELYKKVTGNSAPSGMVKARLTAYVQGTIDEFTALGATNLNEAVFKGYHAKASRQVKVNYSDIINEDAIVELADLKSRLEETGFAVVKVSDDYGGWVTEFDRWIDEYRGDSPDALPLSTRGIFKHWLAHEPFQWEIRKACLPIFAAIHETEELVCSFDGASVLYPGKSSEQFDAWIHNDHPREVTDYTCYQAVVHLTDSGEGDGGVIMVRDSFKVWDDYNAIHKSEGYKWEKMDTRTLAKLGCSEIIKVNCPAGYAVIFNSKMAHCNCPPRESGRRLATYVSMSPRDRLSQKELDKKIKFYETNRMTSHWNFGPYFNANPANPRTYGKEIKVPVTQYYVAKEDEVARRLIGY